jgi:hypothetical protein
MAGTQGDEDAIIRKMRTSGQLQAASLSAVGLAMSIDQSFNVFFIRCSSRTTPSSTTSWPSSSR